MKHFERFILPHIRSSIPETLDPFQFAYQSNCSVDDAVSLGLHTVLQHLDQRNTYVRMLFVDYSSAFNTIIPSKLSVKLRDIGLCHFICNWILNFLSDRQQVVKHWQPHILIACLEHGGSSRLCFKSSAAFTFYL